MKCYVNCSAFFIMILGILSLAAGIYERVKNDELWSVTNWDSDNYVCLSFIVLGVFLFITGIFGLIGGCRKNNCCLAIYNIGTIILFLCFVALAVTSNVGFKNFSKDLNKSDACDNLEWL